MIKAIQGLKTEVQTTGGQVNLSNATVDKDDVKEKQGSEADKIEIVVRGVTGQTGAVTAGTEKLKNALQSVVGSGLQEKIQEVNSGESKVAPDGDASNKKLTLTMTTAPEPGDRDKVLEALRKAANTISD